MFIIVQRFKTMINLENERERESTFSLKFQENTTGVSVFCCFFPLLSQTLGYILCTIPKNESLTSGFLTFGERTCSS